MKNTKHALKIIYWDKDSKEVAIGPWPEVNPNKYAHFGSTGWDAYTALRKASFEERKTMIFIEFAHLVVRDGLDPKALHNAEVTGA